MPSIATRISIRIGRNCVRAAATTVSASGLSGSTRRRFVGDVQHPAHDGDAEQRDEADRRRHAQVDVAYVEGDESAGE
jgi:hypothetical protein